MAGVGILLILLTALLILPTTIKALEKVSNQPLNWLFGYFQYKSVAKATNELKQYFARGILRRK
jgi:hypothetical protein